MAVAFGFQPPAMSPHQSLMQDPIPNIISLPYGKAPPMHIQATSWKHLLRLAAKLSTTRVEPALDALAVTKDPLRLRVVVQFIKACAFPENYCSAHADLVGVVTFASGINRITTRRTTGAR